MILLWIEKAIQELVPGDSGVLNNSTVTQQFVICISAAVFRQTSSHHGKQSGQT